MPQDEKRRLVVNLSHVSPFFRDQPVTMETLEAFALDLRRKDLMFSFTIAKRVSPFPPTSMNLPLVYFQAPEPLLFLCRSTLWLETFARVHCQIHVSSNLERPPTDLPTNPPLHGRVSGCLQIPCSLHRAKPQILKL